MNLLKKISSFKKKPFNPKEQIIHSISELTLDKFIICICEGNLLVLVKDWFNVTKEKAYHDIIDAWDNIYSEYVTAMKDKEQKYLIRLTKEINLLQLKISTITAIVNVMEVEYQMFNKYDEKLVEELKKYMVITGKFDIRNAQQFTHDLATVVANLNRMLTEYETKKIEYDKLVPKNSKTKVDKRYFDDILTQLSKHMKTIVDPKNTTVGFFVSMMNDMRAEIARIELEMRKVKSR